MPAKKPKLNFIMICDDIREEVGNKMSMMGIYQKDIYVPRFPFTFPKLCFVVNYENVKGGDTFGIELFGPSNKQLGKSIMGVAPKNIKGYAGFQIHAVYSPLKVEKEGEYKLTIMVNDDKKGKKESKFAIKEPKKD
jgi:hypothetical protein